LNNALIVDAWSQPPAPKNPYNLTDFAMRVWSLLKTQPQTLPELILASEETSWYVQEALQDLQHHGLASQRGKRFMLTEKGRQ
jgi:DNA-binding IclR family transcriptional regulator